jgi:hypothetical protein
VRLEEDRISIIDGSIWTSAGDAARYTKRHATNLDAADRLSLVATAIMALLTGVLGAGRWIYLLMSASMQRIGCPLINVDQFMAVLRARSKS